MDEEMTTSMAVPLDNDGFIRRECPTCEREFKWLAARDEERITPPPVGGYFCPYCAIQASPDAWHTRAQLEHAKAVLTRELLGPELERFKRKTVVQSGGSLGISADTITPDEPEPLTETDDLRRVDFACHPSEPVKIPEGWERTVHCLMCGRPLENEPAA